MHEKDPESLKKMEELVVKLKLFLIDFPPILGKDGKLGNLKDNSQDNFKFRDLDAVLGKRF